MFDVLYIIKAILLVTMWCYAALVSRHQTVSNEQEFAVDASVTPAPVDKVNAHLRTFPSDPADFRVMLTFHHLDGTLCEAELTHAGATELLFEISRVIHQAHERGARPIIIGEAELS